ncbi:MAG TPA: response regulator, partial [Gaiellaceae bacterium]|nr:response regulator [Gaiellaceae bacterium]
ETADEVRAALAEPWDAIIADYSLPTLDALETLRIVHEHGYDGPFIVVSGTVDEEMTVGAMRAGAHDYVMKMNLRRLVPALERELQEARRRAESREARRRLLEAEELTGRIVEQLPGFVWTADAQLRVTASRGGVELAPVLPHDSLVGQPVAELQRSIALFDADAHERALAGEHVQRSVEWAGRDYLVHVDPFHDDGGAVEGCVAVALDVTDLRAAEEALRESEARFRALIENSLDVTLILLADGTIRYASPSALRVLGYHPGDVVGTNAFDYVHPEDVAVLSDLFGTTAATPGETESDVFRARTKGGEWRLMEAVGLNLLADPAVRGVVVTARDVTARRALEERLSQSERLEAIGQLAGGVAHDFNNVLLVVRGYSTVLRAGLTDPQQIADVDEITKAADRAAALTRQLLAFGRREMRQLRLLALPDSVRDVESLLRRAASEQVELALDLDEETPQVVGDPGQIEQVLLNLVVNARDAMPAGGTITIRAAPATAASAGEVTPPLAPGAYALLSVADTGTGIPDDVLPHVFEPFFSTKSSETGTGLGLSTVYGIVIQGGGSIGVETGENGTTFSVYFPAAAAETAEALEDGGDREELAPGSERVLLVEDEAAVLRLVERVLARAGYEVRSCSSPADALAVLDGDEQFDLLVTDVVMPELSGFDLAERARELRPSLRTLFLSGYSQQAAGDLPVAAALLQKPFAPEELARAVRGVLDAVESA